MKSLGKQLRGQFGDRLLSRIITRLGLRRLDQIGIGLSIRLDYRLRDPLYGPLHRQLCHQLFEQLGLQLRSPR